MGWSGSLSESSAVGSSITYTPDTTTEGAYTVSAFTAPKKGVYRFILKGSGGTLQRSWSSSGTPGTGGYTVGYLLLEKGQTVYIGAGGPCSAAFLSNATGAALKNIAKENLYFVAGAGGGNGNNSYGGGGNGGNGGGTSGANGSSNAGTYMGYGGTQTAAGQGNSGYGNQSGYGFGAGGEYGNDGTASLWRGRGGDGLYGGGPGGFSNGGAGGSGYIHTGSIVVANKTYTNSTQQGGGASGGAQGSVQVTFYALATLPVNYNNTTLTQIFFNGTEIGSLIYNGTKLFFERLRKEIFAWFTSTKTARRLKTQT